MSRMYVIFSLIVCGLAIVGCGQSSDSGQPEVSQPARQSSSGPTVADLDGMDAIQALSLANEWKGNDVTSYITTQSVNFEFPGGDVVSIPLPGDKMVVAIAPYVDKTHPCETHYISGCQGELVNVSVDIVAQLSDDTVVVEETKRTMANGFVELWLPRHQEIAVSLTAEGKSVQGTVSTYDNSRTCITTLQLM